MVRPGRDLWHNRSRHNKAEALLVQPSAWHQEWSFPMHPQPITIPLTQGQVALVDAEDAPRLLAYKWQATRGRYTFYARTAIRGPDGRAHYVRMHHMVLNAPAEMWIDHISGDGLDNRKANLRLCTPQDNCANSRLRRHNTSGYRGITREHATGSWVASIAGHYLGLYPSPEEAARAYDTAARERYGAFARLNFPEEHVPVAPRKGTVRRPNKSGYNGVSWDPQERKWIARLTHHGQRLFLGRFRSAAEAAQAIEEKRRLLSD